MKVSELSRISDHITRFEAVELCDGSFCMYVHWWTGSNIEAEKLYTARGAEKIFKTANAIFSFLGSSSNHAKLDVCFFGNDRS